MRQVGIAALGAIVALALGTATANAATVENGNFETGDLEGWKTDFFGAFEWAPYPLLRGDGVPPPPQGQVGVLSDQGDPSAGFLSQVVKLERGMRHKLKFKLAYDNQNTGGPVPVRRGSFPGFRTPKHFRFGKDDRPNQQFRMDVMKPDAPIRSLKAEHVLEEVYITERGDPNHRNYRTISENLTEHAGDKVRLRFAVAVTEAQLNVGIDSVKIRSKND